MKKISAYENKKIVIELLDFFDKVCKKIILNTLFLVEAYLEL